MDSNTVFFKREDSFLKYKYIKSELLWDTTDGKKKKYCIAIPTYNRLDLLKISLNSAIKQKNINNFEVIIVNNNPEDKSVLEYIKKYKINNLKYYKNEKNIGMFGNWNRCSQLCNAKYFTILNDDDMLSENYLSMVENYVTNKVDGVIFNNYIINEKGEIVYGNKKIMKNMINRIAAKSKKVNLKDYFYGNMTEGSLGVIYKKDKFIKLGGFNEIYYPSADYIFNAYYSYEYNVIKIKYKNCYYRKFLNESYNNSVQKGFISQGYIFKNYIANVFGIKNKKLKIKLVMENQKIGLRDWGNKNTIKKTLLNRIYYYYYVLKRNLNI